MLQNKVLLLSTLLISQITALAMDRDMGQKLPILPQEMNKEILIHMIKDAVKQANYSEIPKILERAASNKKMYAQIQDPKFTIELINLIDKRTKNKIIAAKILKTKQAKLWLEKYKNTGDSTRDLIDVTAKKNDLNVAIHEFGNISWDSPYKPQWLRDMIAAHPAQDFNKDLSKELLPKISTWFDEGIIEATFTQAELNNLLAAITSKKRANQILVDNRLVPYTAEMHHMFDTIIAKLKSKGAK